MIKRVENIISFLESEVSRVKNVEKEKEFFQGLITPQSKQPILVTGFQSGDPLFLLAGLGIENLFPENFVVPFPIECSYGDKVRFGVTSVDGTNMVFYNKDDLYREIGDNWNSVSQLHISAPSPTLQKTNLLFFMIQSDIDSWDKYAVSCRGFIVTLSALDGTVNDQIIEFCRWIDEKLDRKEQIGFVINHTEKTYFGNDFLVHIIKELLGNQTPIFTCGNNTGIEAENSDIVMSDAVTEIFARGAEIPAISEKSIKATLGTLEKGLSNQSETLKKILPSLKNERDEWARAVGVIKNEAIQDRCKLSHLLTDSDVSKLHKELLGFATAFNDSLPAIAEEFLQNSDTPKLDIEYHCGEYIDFVLESFMSALVDEFANGTLVLRAIDVFAHTQNRLALMLNNLPMSDISVAEEMQVETGFLNTLQTDVKKVNTRIARVIGKASGSAVSGAIVYGGDPVFGPVIGPVVGQVVKNVVTNAVNLIVSNKIFVKECIKGIQEDLPPQKTADMMYETMNDSLFSLVIAQLTQAYDRLIDEYIEVISEYIDDIDVRLNVYNDKISAIEAVNSRIKEL